jgi:predicted amidohydrolase YtcJ
MVIRNAAVYTLDPAKPWAQALAVRDGRILAVGDDSDVERLIDPATDVVDAAGAMVMPGLVDVHSHVGFGGQQAAWELVLSPAFTIDDILAAVHDRAVGLGPTSGSSAA